MARPIKRLQAEADAVEELRRRARARTSMVRERERADIILLRLAGMSVSEVGRRLKTTAKRVSMWSRRFEAQGLDGLEDAPGRGRKPSLPPEAVRMVLDKAVTPPATLARWSCRTMAREAGISQASVQRLWASNDIKPHLLRTFKLSKDKQFEAKFWDVVGLYLDPPDKALVLCCDEKSQCQALERTQPGLPLGVGHIRTRTHDYIRHGTVTLFAALNYLDGKLISRIAKRHRHQEWLAFLKTINREVPAGLTLHLIADNYATHKHAKVKAWLAKHPRLHMHFTPTSSSWLNLVERFFRDLTDFITQKSFASLGELSDAILGFLAERNANARRYVWQAKGEEILRKIAAAREKLAVGQVGQM